MDISNIGLSSKTNQILNSLSHKLEIICIFLLLFGFFDMNISIFTATFNVISYGLLLYLLILVAIILLSYLWSAAPDYTADETKTILRSTLFGAYLAAQYHPKNLMQLLMNFFGLAIILNFVYVNLMFATGQSHLAIAMTNNEPSWIGFLTHKQYLGRMAMHSAVIFLLSALGKKKNSWLKWSGFTLSGIILFMSKSKTSWIGFLVSLSLLPVLKFTGLHYKLRTMMYVTVVLLVGCAAVLVFEENHLILTVVLIFGIQLLRVVLNVLY
jgi:exopolysaccharide production protein ExoQ